MMVDSQKNNVQSLLTNKDYVPQINSNEKQEKSNEKEAPHNTRIEQELLGSLLNNNELINRIGDFLSEEYFYCQLHQKIYLNIIACYEKGIIATPITVCHYFSQENYSKEDKEEVSKYLTNIASNASYAIDVINYATIIYEIYLNRQLISIGIDIINNAHKNDPEPEEKIEIAESQLFNLARDNEKESGFKALNEPLRDSINKINIAKSSDKDITGIPADYSDLDQLLGGFQNSDLLILAGRPSMGKTALAINLALNCSKYYFNLIQKKNNQDEQIDQNVQEKDFCVGFFSLEMSSEQLATRMIAMDTSIETSNLRKGIFSEEDCLAIVDANHSLSKLPFFIDDTPALSIGAIKTRARRLKRKYNLGILIIDYLQLVRGSGIYKENRVQEVSEVTQGLKAIAKELDIPVIALSQLSRAVEQREDKRPQLSDLRESGSIEQDSDIVMFIYREQYYLERKQPELGTEAHDKWKAHMSRIINRAEVIVAKHRNGPIGSVALTFDSKNTKFHNYTDRHLEEY